MSKITKYLKENEDSFNELDVMYGLLGVNDYLDKVSLEGLSEKRLLSEEEMNNHLNSNKGNKLNIKEEISKVETKKLSLGKSKLGKRIEEKSSKENDNKESNIKGLVDFLEGFN